MQFQVCSFCFLMYLDLYLAMQQRHLYHGFYHLHWLKLHEYDEKMAEAQIESLNETRRMRDNEKVQLHLKQLRTVAKSNENLMPYLIEAFRDNVTLGEVCQVFKEEFGTFEQPDVI